MRHTDFFLFFVFVFLFCGNIKSQNIITIGFDAGAGYSNATAKITDQLTEHSTKGGILPDFGVSCLYYVDKTYGFTSGLHLISFHQETSGKDYYNAFDAIDTDNKPYERRIWGSSISENLSLHLINIPLHFFYKYSFSRNMNLFVTFGPGISIPVVRNFSGSGTFTYKGYYSDSGVLLFDIPVYGYNSNVSVNKTQKLNTPLAIVTASANVGIAFAMNRYYSFVVSAGYFRSLSRVAKNNNSHSLSNDIGSFNSFLSAEKTVLSNVSISIGITKDILF